MYFRYWLIVAQLYVHTGSFDSRRVQAKVIHNVLVNPFEVCPGKSVDRGTGRLGMTLAVGWDVKLETIQKLEDLKRSPDPLNNVKIG